MSIQEVCNDSIGTRSRSDGDDAGAGGQFTRASLSRPSTSAIGADARFHTCSASEMDAAALIDFLAKRGKFIESEQGFQTHADKA
ncbi:UNVERIFIED_CONTAM: hypothetical protein K2H54_000272 [Gekko kuhli]